MKLPSLPSPQPDMRASNEFGGVGIMPSNCNCNYNCKWYQADCHARAAACRLRCASCKDQCSVAYATALAGCTAAGPGYPGCAHIATLAHEGCKAAC
jgi:hypothetical protein